MRAYITMIWKKYVHPFWINNKLVAAFVLILGIFWLLSTETVSAGQILRALGAGGSPTVVSYQGQVSVGGVPYNGTGYFKFAIVDQAGAATFWSNDGTSTSGVEPTNAVSLSVSNGLFNLLLGDTSLPNMTQALTAAVFDGTDRYLRVWFSTDNAAFILLSPDQQVAAVPYTLQAEEAKTAGDTDTLDGLEGSAYQQQVTGTCAEGSAIQEIVGDGTVTCETDDFYSYSGGNQLSLSGAEFAVNESSGSGLDADLIDGQDSDTYQDRVNETCWYGSAVGAIDSDGSVICGTHKTRPGFSATVLANNGEYNSVTIGADGLPLISFTDGSLKVAHCNDIACTSARISTLESGGGSYTYTSITIGPDGLGLISYSYFDYGDFDAYLKVAHCSNTACSSATITTIDSGSDEAGEYSSITIGTDGLGLISYFRLDSIYRELRVAHCENTACTSVTISIIDSGVSDLVYYSTSIAIGADGLGLISYWDKQNENLRVAHCDNTACTSSTTATIGNSDWPAGESIVIGNDGLGLISYYDFDHGSQNGDLKVAHCNNTACSSVSTSTIDSNVGYTDSRDFTSSAAIGADGLGLISYLHWGDGDLKVAHCSNTTCTSASTATIDRVDELGMCSSITIGADGLGLISYYDGANNDLKAAHLSNVFGIPYFQRR